MDQLCGALTLIVEYPLSRVVLFRQRLVFDPPVFHPVVNPETGELDVKRAFQKWR